MENDILKKYPAAKVRVYAVWFAMIPTDARSAWNLTGRVLADPRVVHFWDDSKVVGQLFAKLDQPQESEPGIMWDAFLLYGPEAQWDVEPKPQLSSGATIRDEFDELEKNLASYLKATDFSDN